MSCSGPAAPPPEKIGQTTDADSAGQSKNIHRGSEDDLDEGEDMPQSGKHKKAREARPALSIEGKKTGVLTDAVIAQQQNEFLGASTLKLSKCGIRLESSSITVIVPPGQQAVVYNAKNGNCMILTSRSRSLLGGGSNYSDEGQQTSTKVGTEKLLGMNCVHYKVSKIMLDAKTKKRWSSGNSNKTN